MEKTTACYENLSGADENMPPATTSKTSDIKSIASTSTAMRSPLKKVDNCHNMDLLSVAVASDHSYCLKKTGSRNDSLPTRHPTALTNLDETKSKETEARKNVFSNSTSNGLLPHVSSIKKECRTEQDMSGNRVIHVQAPHIKMDISTLDDGTTISKSPNIKEAVQTKPEPSVITIKNEPLDDQDMLWSESVIPRNAIKVLEISFFYNVCPLWPNFIVLEELLVPLRRLGVELSKSSLNVFPSLPQPPSTQRCLQSELSVQSPPAFNVANRQILPSSNITSQRTVTSVPQRTSSVLGSFNAPTAASFTTQAGESCIQSRNQTVRRHPEKLKPLKDRLKWALTEVLKNPGIAPVLNHLLKTCRQAWEHRHVIKKLSDFICNECISPKVQCLENLKDFINVFEVLREELGGFANRCKRDRLDIVNVNVAVPTMEERMRLAAHMKQLQDENCKLVAVLQYAVMLLRSLVYQERVMTLVLQMRELEKEMEKIISKEK